MFKNILVVCTGNICRSPMLEVMLKDALQTKDILIHSAGVGAMVGWDAHEHTETILKQHELTAAGHKARQMTDEMAQQADLILALDSGHINAIGQMFPTARGKTFRVGHWADEDVEDPYGHPIATYEMTYDALLRLMPQWLKRI